MTDLRTAAAPATPTGRRAVRPGAVLAVMLVLAAAALVNLVQFPGIDDRLGDNFDALNRNQSEDLAELVYSECDSCRERYGLHMSLYVVAPGSTVTVPRSGPYGVSAYQTDLVTNRLYAIGRVAEVRWVDELPPLSIDPRPYIVASGPGGSRGVPWALAVQSPPAPPSDPDRFLDEALRQERHRHPAGSPREFVLLAWPVPRDDSDHDHQDLLIETSLLAPEPGR